MAPVPTGSWRPLAITMRMGVSPAIVAISDLKEATTILRFMVQRLFLIGTKTLEEKR